MSATQILPKITAREAVPLPSVLPDAPLVEIETRVLGRPSWSVMLLTALACLSAIVNLISSMMIDKWSFAVGLAPWTPFEISQGTHLRMFLASMLLFVLAYGLWRGKRAAWVMTMGTLALAPFAHIGYVSILPQLLINAGLIIFLALEHRHFTVRSDPGSIRLALIVCSLMTVACLTFGTIRLHQLVDQTTGGDDWGSCFQTAIELVVVHHAHAQMPETLLSHNFFFGMRVMGTLIAFVGLVMILRPVLSEVQMLAAHREQARKLIEQYGDDPFDAYALMNDKSYFIAGHGRAVIPYVRSGNFAVVLSDPIGHPTLRSMAIVDFALFCRQRDWEPVFYLVKEDLSTYYKQAGFSLFKIGEGTQLRADQFELKGKEFQNLRTLRNRAQRMGITFRWYDASEGIDEELERRLTLISNRWLEGKKATEMSFDMGSFSIDEIRRDGAGVALDPEGNAIAFATWRPFARGRGRALDLMRYLPEERNMMDFVLVESIFYFNSVGVRDLDMGLAPLANTEKSPSRLVAEEKVVQLLFENLNHVYGYKSLFEFKRKYRPDWCARYVAYRRGVHLPLVGLALLRVHAPKGLWKFLFP